MNLEEKIFQKIIKTKDRGNHECIGEKTVVLYDSSYEVYSNHIIKKFKITDEELKDHIYYIFKHKGGRPIMMYQHHDYRELFKYIDIKYDETIIFELEKEAMGLKKYHLIPIEHRTFKF